MLHTRIIPGTDIKVSPLGLGTVKIGRNTGVKYPEGFVLPSDDEVINLLETAQRLNINYLDTAPAYGISEQRLGNIFKSNNHISRNNWILMSKAGEEFENNESSFNFSRKHIIKSVERSLQRLNTDYLDILLIHSNGDDVEIIENFEVLNTLDYLKQQGLIRAGGMSTKTIEGGILTLQHSDMAMIMYNPAYKDEEYVLDYAASHKKGIVIKKALASGHLHKLAETSSSQDKIDPITGAFKFIFNHQAVNSVIIGTINTQHLIDNVHKVCEVLELETLPL